MGKLIDETGNRYGRLVVLKRAENKHGKPHWVCQCDCGNHVIVYGVSLRNNNTKSCGCLALEIRKAHKSELFINETGNIYGNWTVLERATNNKHSNAVWVCRCVCGKECLVSGTSLRKGNTTCCGCLGNEKNRLSIGESSFNSLMAVWKRNAKSRNREWGLTRQDVSEITKRRCFYCGVAPYQKHRKQRGYGEYVYNGLDRVNNAGGYTIDNVVACCGQCNKAKMDLPYNDFVEWLKRILSYSATEDCKWK